MSFLRPLKARFKDVWRVPVNTMKEFRIAPFPGKREYRWLIATRRGVLYEGKPSRQAMFHVLALANIGEYVTLLEFDKKRSYSHVMIGSHSTDVQYLNTSLWNAYHKMSPRDYYASWKRKATTKRKVKIVKPTAYAVDYVQYIRREGL